MEYKLSEVDPHGIQSQSVHLPRVRLLNVATPARAGRLQSLTL